MRLHLNFRSTPPTMSPVQLTFRHVQPSPAVAARVRAYARRLEKFYDRMTGCHVVITAVQRHQKRANPYQVRIELLVPGTRLVIDRRAAHRAITGDVLTSHKAEESRPALRHQDLYVAIHDAFDVARRQLEDFARKLRSHEVKAK
jgi:ribosome-associated translation inhibitor RaiA